MQEPVAGQGSQIRSTTVQIAIWAAYGSATSAAIGLIFLAIFFSGVPIFGPLNDVAVIIHYILLLPIAIALWRLLKPYGERLNNFALAVGLVGITAVIVLQSLLVFGVMPFSQQIFMVIPAFLTVMLWFVLTGHLGRTDVRVPRGIALHILAGLVFAYPIWAIRLANNLQKHPGGGA